MRFGRALVGTLPANPCSEHSVQTVVYFMFVILNICFVNSEGVHPHLGQLCEAQRCRWTPWLGDDFLMIVDGFWFPFGGLGAVI